MILWLLSNYILMQEALVQLMCNYYTLRQDGSRAYMRSWNLQVKTIFGIGPMFFFFVFNNAIPTTLLQHGFSHMLARFSKAVKES
jgi:hypothetical protein